jgi:transglutaminase-like putative cysteine protease
MTRPPDELERAAQSRPATALATGVAVLLGALALLPVFATGAWIPPVVVAVAAVSLGGIALRAGLAGLLGLRGPGAAALASLGRTAVPLGQLLLVLVVLGRVFTPQHLLFGLLPTPASVADLVGLLGDGVSEIREQATPALPLTGLVALTSLFVALVALCADLLAVPARQPALGGLGLLVLYCVPVSTVTGSVSLVSFAAPAAGFAVLLWADQRGRLVLSTRGGGSGSPLGTATLPALRTGALALVAGVVLSVFVPTLGEGSLASGLGGSGTGNGVGASLDPVAEMAGQLTRPEPIDLLRVDASVEDPGYLRSVALDEYTDTGWHMSNLDGQQSIADEPSLAPLPRGETSRQVREQITVLGHDDQFLPVAYSPLQVDVRGADDEAWRFDRTGGTVFGRDVTTAELSYEVLAQQPEPSVAELAAAPDPAGDDPMLRYTELPELDPSVTELAGRLGAGAATSYDRVRAVLDHFTDPANGFVYSLSTEPGTTGDELADFLRLKRGYCEQYAGAMAVLVRAVGVPARVVLGYTPGEEQPDGSRLVTTDDAHAWVEAWFEGVGWIPFDPTPIAADREVELPWAPRIDAADDTVAQPTAPGAELPVPAGPTAELDRDDQFTPLDTEALQQDTPLLPWLSGAAAVLLVLGLGAVPAVLRRRARRRRLDEASPGALWDELLATTTDLGIAVPGASTSRQFARQLADRLSGVEPAAVTAVRTLALAQERAVYGPPAAIGAPDPAAATALRTVRRALLRQAGREQRLRALLWPASTVSDLTGQLAARTPRRLRSA